MPEMRNRIDELSMRTSDAQVNSPQGALIPEACNGWYPAHEMPSAEDWYVYVVQCGDGSLYTGIAKDVDNRIEEHNAGKGAKYTRGRGPVTLLKSTGPMERGANDLRLALGSICP